LTEVAIKRAAPGVCLGNIDIYILSLYVFLLALIIVCSVSTKINDIGGGLIVIDAYFASRLRPEDIEIRDGG
jgi:hypothetical protein